MLLKEEMIPKYVDKILVNDNGNKNEYIRTNDRNIKQKYNIKMKPKYKLVTNGYKKP